MRIDGMNIEEGSDVVNLVVPNGAIYPENPDDGEIFKLTSKTTLSVYSESLGEWLDMVVSGGEDSFMTASETQSYVDNAVANLSNTTPEIWETMNTISEFLNDNPNEFTTLMNAIATKVNIDGSSVMTGVLRAPGFQVVT